MFVVPNYTETVSMKLSEVLADIGVDERNVIKTRRTCLLSESIGNINNNLLGPGIYMYNFGSQSESTTTNGIDSDDDQLFYSKRMYAIQDRSDFIPGVINHLMIQDNSASPGYCLLQILGNHIPLPFNDESCPFIFKDRTGNFFVKNSCFASYFNEDSFHGPAYYTPGKLGFIDQDDVFALPCTTWPKQGRQWLDHQGEGRWPSAEIKQYCSRSGCFVVPVGTKGSEYEQLEWRISTSFAERCFMFNLNITQIRCYVLMKIIIKTFINPLFHDVISSYMCKTILLHCVANTPLYTWRENNLLNCLSLCLYLLYNNIINENCPHFIIPGNNLMRGKISHAVKPHLLEKLKDIINSKGLALLEIECDHLGVTLFFKLCNLLCPFKLSRPSDDCSGRRSYRLALNLAQSLIMTYWFLKNSSAHEAVEMLKNNVSKTVNCQYEESDKTASHIITTLYCTILGSVLASISINQCNFVSANVLKLILLCLNTDVASSRLKLASILYCVQEIQNADLVLSQIESSYDRKTVEPICGCYRFQREPPRQGFFELCDNINEEVFQYTTASCVIFLPCEIHCVPNELRYEMHRSTKEDRIFRTKRDNQWMDCAVVDSLPYLYFLQYKVYSHLEKQDQKQAALFKLIRTIKEEPNLGHRETALNILGKCMEQEGRAGVALQCYLVSFNIRSRNNAAKIHIATLLSVLINART